MIRWLGVLKIYNHCNAQEEDIDDGVPYWDRIDVNKLSRKDLKAALLERDLDPKGSKKMLRLRLNQALQQEKEEELAYQAMAEARRRANAQLEADGAVYCVGLGSSGQLGQGVCVCHMCVFNVYACVC